MSCLGSTTLVEMIAQGQYPFAHATLMLMEIEALQPGVVKTRMQKRAV